MKKCFYLLFVIIISGCQKENLKPNFLVTTDSITEAKPVINISKTEQKGKEALEFCKTKDFNTDFCILIDMSLHSGLKRFFIYDFNKNEISQKYLVGHGCGKRFWSFDFSKIIQVLVMKITVIFLRWENIDWEKEAIVIGA